MKIGIVTIHHAKYSYGAVLQALAMCRICQRFAEDVEIINYENVYEQKAIKGKNVSLLRRLIITANYAARYIIFGTWRNPYRNSANLDKIYGCVSAQKYTNKKEMQKLQYDVLVCGSDQIWNPEIMNEIDPVFLLDFGIAKRRVSYAASMGSYVINEEEKSKFMKVLSRFTAISVREEHAKQELQSLVENEIKITIDPTLLLTFEDWQQEFPDELRNDNTQNEKYILTFFVWNGFSTYADDVEKYAKEYNLPVWNVQSHSRKVSGIDRVIQAPSVGEFLRLLKNATLVITNSFHGVAFSINFKKNFIPILNAKNPTRVQNLLNKLGIEELVNIEPQKAIHSVDYGIVNERLNALRTDSMMWFEESICGDNNKL